MGTFSDSDPDFWDLGEEGGGKSTQRKRCRLKKSKGFPEFPINVPDNRNKENNAILPKINTKQDVKVPDNVKKKTRQEDEDGNLIDNCDIVVERNAGDGNGNKSENQDSTDGEESDNGNEFENNCQQKDQEEGRGSSSDSSKRTSLVSGSDLPQDSPKDTHLTDELPKSSKGSTSDSQWLVEEYLLPPQQKLKLALYRGRKLLAAKEADGAVREFIRAQALARIVHGDQHWRYCRCKVFLAQTYLYLKEYAPQGEAQAQEALETINVHLSTDLAPAKKPQVHHTLLWGYLISGEARIILGQLVGAQEALSLALYHTHVYSRMVSRWKKKLTPSLTMDRALDLQVKVLCAQATLYTKRRKYIKAREKLESSIKTIESGGTGVDDPGLVDPLQQLGQLLLNHSQTDEDSEAGLECLTRAVHITQVSNRPGSVAECEARRLLVEHQLRLRRMDTKEALRELHKLGLLYSRLHGEHSPKTLAIHSLTVQVCGVLRQLSRVHALSGDFSPAASALDQCLHAEISIYGSSSRRAQASRLRLQDMIIKLPLSLRMKMYRKHPELQNKPRFRNI
ncbi:tetratricopeptide repeat protein 23-like isoform X2 [Homarus americanus]|uniref:tetratricopeptide repeat protein 23-like isoform X2 n=1 Tax=Homarus americanus TaxID=6706 RepID=UPI001C4561DC|nr:tetratricopeptide repeat protein 23-like isoform X2 [Homarus americanus]